MRIILIFFSVFLTQNLWAQTPVDKFVQANNDFRAGRYDQAVASYESIVQAGFESAEVYYNLGNAYYKLNKIAPSVYNYEKALLLDPKHEDAKNNLVFAQRMAIDVIEPMPKTLFQRASDTLIFPISHNNWAWISIILVFASALFFVWYYFSAETGQKRIFFILTFVFLGLFLIALFFSFKARHQFVNDHPAIIFESIVSVKSEPGSSNTEVFVLHEGTKVQVIDYEENWVKIKLADGKMGWMLQQKLKKLK